MLNFSKPKPNGERNATLTGIAGKLTSLGVDATSTRATLHTINKNHG
jgi:hypothetical protein